MSEEIEYQGYWWLPENPDYKIPGQLVIVPYKEAYIELQGDFHEGQLFGKIEGYILFKRRWICSGSNMCSYGLWPKPQDKNRGCGGLNYCMGMIDF